MAFILTYVFYLFVCSCYMSLRYPTFLHISHMLWAEKQLCCNSDFSQYPSNSSTTEQCIVVTVGLLLIAVCLLIYKYAYCHSAL